MGNWSLTVQKNCGKQRKYWLPAFSTFPITLSKGFLFQGIKTQDCVVKG